MSATSTATFEKRPIRWSLSISVLLILAGFLAIAIPGTTGVAVSEVFGWLLILSAIGHLLFAFYLRSFGGFLWELLQAVLYSFVGAYLLFYPVAGLVTITFVLAIYLFTESALELILSFQIRPRPGWVGLLFDAIVTLVLALLIWRTWPSNSEWVIGTLLGIGMLFSGISRLVFSLAVLRIPERS